MLYCFAAACTEWLVYYYEINWDHPKHADDMEEEETGGNNAE